MKIRPIFLYLMVLLTACSENKYRKAANEIADNAPSSMHMNEGKEKYTLYIPEGWTTERRTAYNIDYYFLLAPKTKDDPNTNINVITEGMQDFSLADFKAKTIESVKQAIPSAKIIAQGDIIANGLKGSWYSYSMEPQGIKVSLVSYIFPKNGIAYVITAGTQMKDADSYRSVFDSVARSLKFIGK